MIVGATLDELGVTGLRRPIPVWPRTRATPSASPDSM